MQITVRELSKRFGAVLAVVGVTLEIADGELFTLLGPSGCGKTTLLRLIAGFHRPDAGAHPLRGPGRDRPPAACPQHRHGLPELRPLAAHDRVPERGVRAQAPPSARRRARRPGRRGAAQGQPVRPRRALPGPALRRPATAGRPGAGARAQPGHPPPRRAAVEPRREDPRAGARRRSGSSSGSSESRRSTSPTTRKRRCPCPTAWPSCATARSSSSARPRELYESPRTRFVADFVGTNNLVAGRVLEAAERGRRRGDRPRAPPGAASARRRPISAPGQGCVLAIRPENVTIGVGGTAPAPGDANRCAGRITLAVLPREHAPVRRRDGRRAHAEDGHPRRVAPRRLSRSGRAVTLDFPASVDARPPRRGTGGQPVERATAAALALPRAAERPASRVAPALGVALIWAFLASSSSTRSPGSSTTR